MIVSTDGETSHLIVNAITATNVEDSQYRLLNVNNCDCHNYVMNIVMLHDCTSGSVLKYMYM